MIWLLVVIGRSPILYRPFTYACRSFTLLHQPFTYWCWPLWPFSFILYPEFTPRPLTLISRVPSLRVALVGIRSIEAAVRRQMIPELLEAEADGTPKGSK
jgi:hypothetical protein